MAEALVDSNVLFAFRNSGDQYHDRARAIVEGIDEGELPRGIVTSYVLPEVLNPIYKLADHDTAVETLDLLDESAGFRIRRLTKADFQHGQALFRRFDTAELTDALTAAHMRRVDAEYIYSFDDDFDEFEAVTRLTTADNPFDPESSG